MKTEYITEIEDSQEYRTHMAQLIRDELIVYIQEGAKTWLDRSEPDLHIWDTVLKDAEDLRIVHTRLERDEIPFAFNKACDLDTAVRDVIPTKVWNWMSRVHAASK